MNEQEVTENNSKSTVIIDPTTGEPVFEGTGNCYEQQMIQFD